MILALLISINVFAQTEPKLPAIRVCAQKLAEAYVLSRRIDSTIFNWYVLDNPPVATSALALADLSGPKFITITDDAIYSTPATVHIVNSDNVDRKIQVTLNLSGKIDPETHFPIVDPHAEAKKFGIYNGHAIKLITFLNLPESGFLSSAERNFSAMKAPYSEIKPTDALSGGLAQETTRQMVVILKQHVLSMPGYIRYLYADLSKSKFNLFLNKDHVRMIHDKICSCEGIMPEEANEVRKTMTAPEYPVLILIDDEKPRQFTDSDLSCGMV
jgi:hypothetical protein